MIVLFLALRLWSCENIQYNIWNKLQGSAESEYKQAFCLFIFYLCHFRQQSLAMAQSQVSEKAALCFHCHLSQAYQQQHHLLLSRYVVCLYTNFWNDPFLYLTNVPFSCTFLMIHNIFGVKCWFVSPKGILLGLLKKMFPFPSPPLW